jgi:glycosyltransferase involved in cell wall biosynthesis
MTTYGVSHPSEAAKKRIAIVSAALPPLDCGEAMSTYFTALKLAESGVDVHVVTTRRRVVANVPGATIHAEMERWSWTEIPRLVRCLRHLEPDGVLLVYMAAMYECHPMITFLPSILRRVLPATRIVTRFEHVSGASDPSDVPWPTRLGRRVALAFAGSRQVDSRLGTLVRDSDAVIALCSQHHRVLRERCPELTDKIVIIPPPANFAVAADPTGVHRRRGRERVGAGPSDVVIGYMGYLYPNKGVEDLLRAVAAATRRSDLRLIFLGGRIGTPGSEFFEHYGRMQELAGRLELADRVTWSGSFAHDDDDVLPSYFHAVDFWVLPFVFGAHLNNSSLTSLMTHGRAIVTTRGEVAEDVLLDGENVLLVPPGDPRSLAGAIDRLATDPALRESLAAGALRLGRERLSWATAVARTLETLLGE